MKTLAIVLLAASASVFASAADAKFNYNGYYLVTFNDPSGSFQHCIGLTDTEQYQSQGYTYSGTWVDTDFPDTGGTWAVYDRLIHFAGYVDGSTEFLTIDGKVANEELRSATFDYFNSTGTYNATGSATVAADDSCSTPSVRKGGNSRNFLK